MTIHINTTALQQAHRCIVILRRRSFQYTCVDPDLSVSGVVALVNASSHLRPLEVPSKFQSYSDASRSNQSCSFDQSAIVFTGYQEDWRGFDISGNSDNRACAFPATCLNCPPLRVKLTFRLPRLTNKSLGLARNKPQLACRLPLQPTKSKTEPVSLHKSIVAATMNLQVNHNYYQDMIIREALRRSTQRTLTLLEPPTQQYCQTASTALQLVTSPVLSRAAPSFIISVPPPPPPPAASNFHLLASAAAERSQARPDTHEVLRTLGSTLRTHAESYIDVSSCRIEPSTTKTRGGVIHPFPERLHRLLQDAQDSSEVVSFDATGRCFAVFDISTFVQDWLPKYFCQTKWNSFGRQLNLYGFRRVIMENGVVYYYHELFLRGKPELVSYMRRVGVFKGRGGRSKVEFLTKEPDFEQMPFLPPYKKK